ncbi:hypothetical protein [Rhizobium sp. YS-1r]|uniref:hypothetical protein n=1 Tax=Rhizobium sp. YS-1r TaxID=1532558 RepID=UPI00050E3FA2|nr:hypothetical protein [Rhizobium sp. YS-1r]KGD99854.1 hypothetical protein JL39_09840 [Rhizobium sp. YS-1r]
MTLVQHVPTLFVPKAFYRNIFSPAPFTPQHRKEKDMNSIIWLVGAIVIVIAILNLVGFA